MHDKLLYERLISNITVDEHGCWLWQRSLRTDGYGQVAFEGRRGGTHRAMWYAIHGEWFPFSSGVLICHTCDVRRCLNPAHLWKGSSNDNGKDRDRKGRNYWKSRTVCKHGHSYTPENTLYQHDGKGRRCAECVRQAHAARRERKRILLGTKRRPPVLSEEKRREALVLVEAGMRYSDICRKLSINRMQLFRARQRKE